MKDNFSSHSPDYAKFRPAYPVEIYKFIKNHIKECNNAWDCGTGNGQVASEIAEFFKRVEATDISKNQLQNGIKKPNINYTVQSAENANFKDDYFDLVICGQSVHWFNFDKFYREVNRCLKSNGLIIIMGYGLFSSNPETNKIITHFYNDIIGSYWDFERKYLDDNYETIPFPFREINSPQFVQTYQWDIDHLLGYLRTWSAVKHYENRKNNDPVSLIESDLRKSFGKQNQVKFPILFKMGKKVAV